MNKLVIVMFFLILTVSTADDTYNETLARYNFFPMASAAYADNPGLCLNDNFADAEVENYYFFYKTKFTVQTSIYRQV